MIDIGTLHIGSHVSIGGKMHRVAAIDALNEQIGIDAYTTDAKGVKHSFGYKVEDVDPIPITKELLTELGFEYCTTLGGWRKEQTAETPFIGIDKLHDGLWRVNVANDIYVYGNILCEYLHQAEQFLYLTTKTELIKK